MSRMGLRAPIPKGRDYTLLGATCRPLYDGGLSTHAIAAELKVSQPVVVRALRAVGCPLRTQTEALKIIGYGRIATDEQIAAALKSEGGNAAKAAKKAGISAVAVHKRLKKSAALRAVLATAKGR